MLLYLNILGVFILLCRNPSHDARLEQLIKCVVHKRATEDLQSSPETLGPSRDPGSAHYWEVATLSAEGRFRIRRAQTLWAHCCSVWSENEVSWTLESEWKNTRAVMTLYISNSLERQSLLEILWPLHGLSTVNKSISPIDFSAPRRWKSPKGQAGCLCLFGSPGATFMRHYEAWHNFDWVQMPWQYCGGFSYSLGERAVAT